MTETVTQPPTSADIGNEEDLRLVLEAFREAGAQGLDAAIAGHVRLPAFAAQALVSEMFGSGIPETCAASVYPRAAEGQFAIAVEFDLHRITAELRGQIAGGIGRNRLLIDMLGGVPVEVTDRLDAARSAPRLAAHLIATAADHLVWKVRLHIQDALAPVYDDGDILSWAGSISVNDVAARQRIGQAIPFATALRLEVPASMEKRNA